MSPRAGTIKVDGAPTRPAKPLSLKPQSVNMLVRLADTRWDIVAFSRLLGIEPNPGQIAMWRVMLMRDETLWRALWLTICVSAGNRAGKTLGLAIAILHHTVHKIGLRPVAARGDDKEFIAWLKEEFHWYHFGIQQEIGELVYNEIAAILEGRHEAQQRNGCPLVDELGKIAEIDKKERGEYRWVRLDPMLGGGEIHFRTTNEKALGSLGKKMNGISFDEPGFENNLSFIVDEVLNFRRMSTGGSFWLIATPSESFPEFRDVWERGNPENPEKEPYNYSMRLSTRDNIGYGIDQGTFDKLLAGYPPSLIPQNIDGYFIEGRNAFFNYDAVDKSFRDDLPVAVGPRRGGFYAAGIDPAVRYDGTWIVVLRANGDSAMGVCVSNREGKQTTKKVVDMLVPVHTLYNQGDWECVTGMDTSGFGGKVFHDDLADALGPSLPPVRQVEFGGVKSRKLRLLLDLKSMLEEGRLIFPRTGVWLKLRRQLMNYRLEDKGLATDGVMALAIAVKMFRQSYTAKGETAAFDFWGSSDPKAGYTPDRASHLNPMRLRKVSAVSRVAEAV